MASESKNWRNWAIDDTLKNTDTYDILYNQMEEVEFSSLKDLCNFIKYCEYMMFSNYNEPHPIAHEECCEYFRSLYKYVEMIYEDNILIQMAANKQPTIVKNG